ncbi:MAG: SIMPL domain-containing protein [Limnobacter sp.]|nr:SIMPL domain-containing protein [Limnobacter sp.]
MKQGAHFFATFCAGAALLPFSAAAQDCEQLPQVSLQQEASIDVSNDLIGMNWQVQIEKPSAALAVKAVNQALEAALGKIKSKKALRNVRSNIQTYPVYDKNREISHWRATGDLSFEQTLLSLKEEGGQVQIEEPLALQSIVYSISPELAQRTESELLENALAAYRQKAERVAKELGYAHYRIGQISVNDSGNRPMPIAAPRAMSLQAKRFDTAEVAASGGESQISVGVSGSVCLIK